MEETVHGQHTHTHTSPPSLLTSTLPEEIVSKERIPRAIRQDNSAEVRVDRNHVGRGIESLALRKRFKPPTVRQDHVSVFEQSFQDANDLERGLVRFVDHQDPSFPTRSHQRRVAVSHDAVLERWRERERLHGRIAMQLDVLAFTPEQAQQPVDQLVLANTLVASGTTSSSSSELGSAHHHHQNWDDQNWAARIARAEQIASADPEHPHQNSGHCMSCLRGKDDEIKPGCQSKADVARRIPCPESPKHVQYVSLLIL